MSAREGLPPAAAPAGAPASVESVGLRSDRAYWPHWRGPGGQGLAADAGVPTRWSRSENVAWRTEIPGRGHSSPVVHGDLVVLTSALDEGRRKLVIGIDRRDGKILWQSEFADTEPGSTHGKHGYASSTAATDGRVVVVFFNNLGLLGLDLGGNELWRRPLGRFTGAWGTASSPIIHRDTAVLCVDDDAQCFIAAVHLADGSVKWRRNRDQDRSFSTPLVVDLGGAREVVINGKGRVWAYDPDTGEPLWVCDGMTEWVTPTVVAGHGLVYAVSGRNGPTLAIRPGGRGNVTGTHVVWRGTHGAPYIPSPVLYDGRLYMTNDGGLVTVYDAADGRKVYQHRMGGAYTASPVVAGGNIYFVSEDGDTQVVAAGPEFKTVATNSLGETCLASPAVARGRLLIRTEKALYCIGPPEGSDGPSR
jgi:outer membrane protein assembly factor BamB